MPDKDSNAPRKRRFGLDTVSGTTVAFAALAVLGAAAVVTTPVWFWYRHKRKRADAMLRESAEAAGGGDGPEQPGDSRASQESPDRNGK